MPYIYSIAGLVAVKDGMMIEPLFFQFKDRASMNCQSQFMLGKELMVCPITSAMYYDPKSNKLDTPKIWKCYMPEGTEWIDFYTGERYPGGITVDVTVNLSHIPVFAKAGSIIPMEEKLDFAMQKVDTPLKIRIYDGADGSFTYYEDSGDGYDYEKGQYNLIEMSWNDEAREFAIGSGTSNFYGGIVGRDLEVIVGDIGKTFRYEGKEMNIKLT